MGNIVEFYEENKEKMAMVSQVIQY